MISEENCEFSEVFAKDLAANEIPKINTGESYNNRSVPLEAGELQ